MPGAFGRAAKAAANLAAGQKKRPDFGGARIAKAQ